MWLSRPAGTRLHANPRYLSKGVKDGAEGTSLSDVCERSGRVGLAIDNHPLCRWITLHVILERSEFHRPAHHHRPSCLRRAPVTLGPEQASRSTARNGWHGRIRTYTFLINSEKHCRYATCQWRVCEEVEPLSIGFTNRWRNPSLHTQVKFMDGGANTARCSTTQRLRFAKLH